MFLCSCEGCGDTTKALIHYDSWYQHIVIWILYIITLYYIWYDILLLALGTSHDMIWLMMRSQALGNMRKMYVVVWYLIWILRLSYLSNKLALGLTASCGHLLLQFLQGQKLKWACASVSEASQMLLCLNPLKCVQVARLQQGFSKAAPCCTGTSWRVSYISSYISYLRKHKFQTSWIQGKSHAVTCSHAQRLWRRGRAHSRQLKLHSWGKESHPVRVGNISIVWLVAQKPWLLWDCMKGA